MRHGMIVLRTPIPFARNRARGQDACFGADVMNASDVILDRTRVREVTGIFHSRHALDAAAYELLLMGFDRGHIDVLASLDELPKRLGPVYVAPEELADVKDAPRRPFVSRDDVTVVNTVVAGTVGAVIGAATAYFMLVSGASETAAGMTAVLVALIAAAIAFLLTTRFFRREETHGLDWLMAHRGLILWVHVRSSEQEDIAQAILRAHGARAVRVHEIEMEKRPEDLPLGTVRPDPWLGSEPLGHP
jgi:uncharacterized membrane protein YeaQ/YmgE (transglycosylase-associated protein family)